MNKLIKAMQCYEKGGIRDLAETIGCSKDTLYGLQKGKVLIGSIRFATVVSLCRVLKVEISDVANDPE